MAFPILKFLALPHTAGQRPTRYRIGAELKIERHTVLTTMRLLEDAELVRVTEKRVWADERGRSSKEYEITLQGLVALLQGSPEHIRFKTSEIHEIARNNEALLPVIFRKWHVLSRDTKTEDFAANALLDSVKETENEVTLFMEPQRDQSRRALTSEARDCIHRHNIYAFMLVGAWAYIPYAISRGLSPADCQRWRDIITNDSDLSYAAKRELERLEAEAGEDWNFWLDCNSALDGKKQSDQRMSHRGFDKLDPKNAPSHRLLRDYWLYRRAKAIEDNTEFLTMDDCLNEIQRGRLSGKVDGLRLSGLKARTSEREGAGQRGTGK
jgi:Mn-dependent DtxR family transcriptional regulator